MLTGEGLLALWNGVEPGRAAEYDLWHTREHVPERLQVPGMISARRYVDGEGELPRYFTLYDVTSTDVFESRPYRALLEGPTEWSRSMRPSFRGFFRLACRPVARFGGGMGGALVTTTLALDRDAPGEGVWKSALAGALAIPAVTAAHAALVAPEISAVPFTIGAALPDYPRDAVLALEGYDRAALKAALPDIEAWFRSTPLRLSRTVWTSYVLGYAVAQEDLAEVVPTTRPLPAVG